MGVQIKNKMYRNSTMLVGDFETTYESKRAFNDRDLYVAETGDAAQIHDMDIAVKDHNKTQVFLSGIYNIKTDEFTLCYEDLQDSLDAIYNIAVSEGRSRVYIYYHNANFDCSFWFRWLISKGYKQTLAVKQSGDPKLIGKQFALLLADGKFYSLALKYKDITITFLDSLKLLPQTLNKLGIEMLGMKKEYEKVNYKEFILDKNHNYPAKWLEYHKTDCVILGKCMKMLYKEDSHLNTRRQTAASISYAKIRNAIESYTDKKEWTIKHYNKFSKWYNGGRCTPNYKYWGKWVIAKGKIKCIDACSMYPSQAQYELPFGLPLKEKPTDTTYCSFYKIKINFAVIKEKYKDHPLIWKEFETRIIDEKEKRFSDPKLIYQYQKEVENAVYYITDIELDLWNQFYVMDYEILETYYFRTAKYLAEPFLELFKAKQEAARAGNKALKLIKKIYVNSAYGGLGKKPVRTKVFYGTKEEIEKQGYKIISKHFDVLEAYNIQEQNVNTDKSARYIPAASYITARARVCLMSTAKKLIDAGNEVLYCDTDSLFFIENSPVNDIKIGDNLGDWEYEEFVKQDKTKTNYADAFCSLCPKQYRTVIYNEPWPVKIASAGVKSDKEEHTGMYEVKNQDYNYDLGSNKKYHICKTLLKDSEYGKVICEGDFNFIKWGKIKSQALICPAELYN